MNLSTTLANELKNVRFLSFLDSVEEVSRKNNMSALGGDLAALAS